MQSSSLHLSPNSYLKPKLNLQQNPNAGSYPYRQVPQRASLDSAFIHSSPSFMTHFSSSNRLVHSRSDYFVARATSLPESTDGSDLSLIGLVQSFKLCAMFATWYLLSIYFNILNKQVSWGLFVLHY